MIKLDKNFMVLFQIIRPLDIQGLKKRKYVNIFILKIFKQTIVNVFGHSSTKSYLFNKMQY